MDLKVTTKEGITFKNVRHFPSNEWGENGGTSADVYYKGTHVAKFVDYGDGGAANIDFINGMYSKDIDNACMTALKRLDPSLQKYSWLWNKDHRTNGDDYGMLCAYLECVHTKLSRIV